MLSLYIKFYLFQVYNSIEMAYYVSEKNRWIQRLMVIIFRIAKDLSPNIITQKWVAKYLNSSAVVKNL